MRAQMVLTYVISKGVISNLTVDEIVCPALILAANSTDDLHVQNNIVTVSNCDSFYRNKIQFLKYVVYDRCQLKDMGSEMRCFKIISLSCLSCCINYNHQ